MSEHHSPPSPDTFGGKVRANLADRATWLQATLLVSLGYVIGETWQHGWTNDNTVLLILLAAAYVLSWGVEASDD